MVGGQPLWSDRERATLRHGPLWVLSALTGRTRFDDDEKLAFWDCVTDAALKSHGPGRDLLSDLAGERKWLFEEFVTDDRSVVSGILAVTGLLERMSADDRDDVRRSLMRVGRSFAQARGPFGRRMLPQDEQTLLLFEQLLQTAAETADDNPLNSAAPI